MKGYIYKYTYPNGKVYIGQTRRSVEERHMEHMAASKKDGCTICELAIRKYGEPTLETIEEIEVDDTNPTELVNKLNEAEERWIKHYDCTNDSGKGYNVQLGGEVVTPQEFILQEEWYRIFEEEGWGEGIVYVKGILSSVGEKLFVTKEKLDKEERRIFYGYTFTDSFGKKTTFNSCNKQLVTTHNGIDGFNDKMNEAVGMWIEDIRQTIWSKVMKRKKKVIKEFYKKK